MSRYGYPYGPPPGYQPPAPPPAYSYPPQQMYAPPNYPPPEAPPPNSFPGYGVASQASYNYNQNSIPGLGLNFPNQHQTWHHGWAHQPSGPPTSLPQPVSGGQIAIRRNSARSHRSTGNEKQKRPADADNEMEEGELSEGELDDAYEPGEVLDLATAAPSSSNREAVQGPPSPTQTQPIDAVPGTSLNRVEPPIERVSEPSGPSRERSGSYSPFLTSKELHLNAEGTSVPEPLRRADTMTDPVEQLAAISDQVSHIRNSENVSTENPASAQKDTPLLEMKNRALEAILRLWPLNVRYQNYVEEGINKTVVGDLFTELGLEFHEETSAPKKVAKLPPGAAVANPAPPAVENKEPALKIAGSKHEEPQKPVDKAEERKDKIARLLALKGSKGSRASAKPPTANTMKPATATTTATSTSTPSSNSQSKTVSEKSKLLQQKMEALRKAREAMAEKASQRDSTALSDPVPTLISPTSTPIPAVISSPEASSLAQPPTQSPEDQDEPESQANASIPGLFLSSTPQPSPGPNGRKRPLAADLNDISTASVPKRQFGQPRPFLIDVSDDEDDAEMEIDSPEQHFSSVHRPATPVGKTSSFRDHAALSDAVPHRHISTPSALGTPSGTSGTPNGVYDLESMNKKIEDMKRKIAEAEARKKARQSRQGSPSLSQSQQESKESSAGPSVMTKPPFPLVRAETEDNRSMASVPGQATLVLPKIRGQGPKPTPSLRSRIASERLPLVEARRRDKESQLKQLESEIARIKQEIEQDVAEEDQLRGLAQEAEESEEAGAETDLGQQSPSSKSEPPLVQAQTPVLQPPDDASGSPLPVAGDVVPATSDQEPEQVVSQGPDDGGIDEPYAASSWELDAGTMASNNASEPPIDADIAANANVAVLNGAEGQQDSTADSKPDSDSGSGSGSGSDSEAESPLVLNPDDDVAMDEADELSGADDSAESSDEYEPEEATEPLYERLEEMPHASSPESVGDGPILETTDTDMQGAASASPVAQPISAAREDTGSSEAEIEVETRQHEPVPRGPRSTFVPYESPLRYFHAFRFHPGYKSQVDGGLRSLTYTNKIDIHKEVCPEQLIHGGCSRGPACEFQHFEDIEAPDDQILLQLGAYGNFEGEQKQQYIAGLRDLLSDLRNRKIKDFDTISQGIVEYRARFHGDKTKILPLGNVAI